MWEIDPSILSHEIRSFFLGPFCIPFLPNFGRLEINSHIVFWSIFISFFVSFCELLELFCFFLHMSIWSIFISFFREWAFLSFFVSFFVKVWSIFVSFFVSFASLGSANKCGEVYGVQSGASRAMVTRESILEREKESPPPKSKALGRRHKKNMRKTS